MKARVRLAAVVIVGALVGGCGAAPTPSALMSRAASAAASDPDASDPAPTSSAASEAATLPTCLFETCPELPAGTYVTTGPEGFLPGLRLTIPAGYSTYEHSTGELELHRTDDVDGLRQIFIWRDLRAVVGVGGPAGPPEIVDGVDGSPEALLAWLETDGRFETSAGQDANFGNVVARWMDVVVSAAAINEEPLTDDGGCDPAEVVCIGVFYDPVHWVNPGYAYGMLRKAIPDPSPGECCEHLVRFHFAEVGSSHDPTTLVVALSVFDVDPLASIDAWQEEVQPILDSLVVPPDVP